VKDFEFSAEEDFTTNLFKLCFLDYATTDQAGTVKRQFEKLKKE
jgi:hypothetical protein